MLNESKSEVDILPDASFEPDTIHRQMTTLLRQLIFDGTFAAGERIPSERELASKYDISRATANKVISTLVAEDLLEIRKGIGAIVNRQKTLFASLAGMESFTGHIQDNGLTPSTKVLTFRKTSGRSVSAAVRDGLKIEKSESLIYLERLRLADGNPMIIETRWIRASLAPDLTKEDVADSFYRVLEERYQLAMTGEEHTITAEMLSDKNAKLMEVKAPAVTLCVEGTGYVRAREPLWYQKLYYNGSRYQLKNETLGNGKSKIELQLKPTK